MTASLPVGLACPKGHSAPGYRIVRDGGYGKVVRRQRYRCIGPNGQSHSFAPPMPREHTHGGVCSVCDSVVAPQVGLVVSRVYQHRLHLVAEALVAVGRGVSYARALQRARVASGRDLVDTDGAGQLVAEWVDVWAPVIINAFAETDWAETLVLDDTDFRWTNPRTQRPRREFAVLVAYGYTPDGRGRIWGARASATTRSWDYIELVQGMNLVAPPRTIVADDSRAIAAAARKLWPRAPGPSLPFPFLFACEHHLRLGAEKELAAHLANAPRGRWMKRLDTAFRRSEGWDEFVRTARIFPAVDAWIQAHEPRLTIQTAVRHLPSRPPFERRSGAGERRAAALVREAVVLAAEQETHEPAARPRPPSPQQPRRRRRLPPHPARRSRATRWQARRHSTRQPRSTRKAVTASITHGSCTVAQRSDYAVSSHGDQRGAPGPSSDWTCSTLARTAGL